MSIALSPDPCRRDYGCCWSEPELLFCAVITWDQSSRLSRVSVTNPAGEQPSSTWISRELSNRWRETRNLAMWSKLLPHCRQTGLVGNSFRSAGPHLQNWITSGRVMQGWPTLNVGFCDETPNVVVEKIRINPQNLRDATLTGYDALNSSRVWSVM